MVRLTAVPLLFWVSISSMIFAVRRPNFRLEDAVVLKKGEAVATSFPATSEVTLPNFKQCLRLCWYASNCADISYNFDTKSCRLFDVASHSMAHAVIVKQPESTFASVLNTRKDQVSRIDHAYMHRSHAGIYSLGAVWETRWPSWAGRLNEPSGFRWRKAISSWTDHVSAFVSVCPK